MLIVRQVKSKFKALTFFYSWKDLISKKAWLLTAEKWDKAYAIFQEMEATGIQPDVVACSALMRAFNKGSQPAKVLSLLEYMKEKNIPISDAIYFEVISACSL